MTETTPKKKIRFHDREPQEVKEKIHKMADAYVYSEPFPLPYEDVAEIDFATIDDKTWGAIKYVIGFDSDMIASRYSFQFIVEGVEPEEGDRWHYVNISDRKGSHIYTTKRALPRNSKYHAPIKKWMDETLERKELVSEFKEHIHSVFYWCNTPGQVKTMYPALVELLPERHQQALAKSVRATRWPNSWSAERQAEFLQGSEKFGNMVVLLKMVYEANKHKSRGDFEVTVE